MAEWARNAKRRIWDKGAVSMTNFEKWKDEILKLAKNNRIFAVDKRDMSVYDCENISCCECTFQDGSYDCNNERIMWLYEEYQEPPVDWSKVEVDTKVLVSDSGNHWSKRYFFLGR